MTRTAPDNHLPCSPSNLGFSLIEVLVVLLLLGIIASIAIPAYDGHLRRGHRAEAQAALLKAAHHLEREATVTGTYPAADAGLPEALAQVPSGRYLISREASASELDAALRFRLHATPLGSQVQDTCGTFTLSNAGERGLIGNRSTVASCWNR